MRKETFVLFVAENPEGLEPSERVALETLNALANRIFDHLETVPLRLQYYVAATIAGAVRKHLEDVSPGDAAAVERLVARSRAKS